MQAFLEKCWKCGSIPRLEKKMLFSGEISLRYVCEKCKHKSTSVRMTKEEALANWNKSAKVQTTKQVKREMGLYE